MDYSKLSKAELIKIIEHINGLLEQQRNRIKTIDTKGFDNFKIESMESYWEDIINALPLSLAMVDSISYHWTNKHTEVVSGYSNDEWINMPLEERALIFEFPAKPETLIYMDMFNKQGKEIGTDSVDMELKLKRKDGRWIWLFTRNTLVYNPQKNDYEILVASIDITERKNHELEIERLNEELEDLIARERLLSKENEKLLKKQILEKDKELNRLAVFLTEKNNCLLKLKKQAVTFSNVNIKEIQKIASEIMNSIDEKLNSQSAWDTFEIQFESSNPNFIFSLLKLYPELSQMEIRVCTLSKLELSTKAMAQILNLSTRTVEAHRMSIRKKMKLKNKEQLSLKLNSITHKKTGN